MTSQIQHLIATGKTMEALDRLMELLGQRTHQSSSTLNDVINLKNQYHEISRKENLYLITHEQAALQKSRINNAALSLLQTSQNPEVFSRKITRYFRLNKILKNVGIAFIGLMLLGFILGDEPIEDLEMTPNSKQLITENEEQKQEDFLIEGLEAYKNDLPYLFEKEEARNKKSKGVKVGKWVEYFDANWKVLRTKEGAAFYRLVDYKNGKPMGISRDFYASGNLQWIGQLISTNPDQYKGWGNWFFENGKIQQIAFYKNGRIHGEHRQFYENGMTSVLAYYHLGNQLKASVYDPQRKLIYQRIDHEELMDEEIRQNGFVDVLLDDFSTNNGKWSLAKNKEIEFSYRNGKYLLKNKTKKQPYIGFKEENFIINENRNFEIEVTTFSFNGNAKNAFGLIWGAKDFGTYSAFLINPDGFFSVFDNTGDGFTGNIEQTEVLKKDNLVNKLRVRKTGNRYDFFINDQKVKPLPFTGFYGQHLGFFVGSNQKIAFDDFRISYF